MKSFEEFLLEKRVSNTVLTKPDIKKLNELTQINFIEKDGKFYSVTLTGEDIIEYLYKPSNYFTQKELLNYIKYHDIPNVDIPYDINEIMDMVDEHNKEHYTDQFLVLSYAKRAYMNEALQKIMFNGEQKGILEEDELRYNRYKIILEFDQAQDVIDHNGVFIDAGIFVDLKEDDLSRKNLDRLRYDKTLNTLLNDII